MTIAKRYQGFLAQYFLERDKERGLSCAYGLRKMGDMPLYLVKTAPIVRFDRKNYRLLTHYGSYSLGELITDPEEQCFYKHMLGHKKVYFLDDFIASVPLSVTIH